MYAYSKWKIRNRNKNTVSLIYWLFHFCMGFYLMYINWDCLSNKFTITVHQITASMLALKKARPIFVKAVLFMKITYLWCKYN